MESLVQKAESDVRMYIRMDQEHRVRIQELESNEEAAHLQPGHHSNRYDFLPQVYIQMIKTQARKSVIQSMADQNLLNQNQRARRPSELL